MTVWQDLLFWSDKIYYRNEKKSKPIWKSTRTSVSSVLKWENILFVVVSDSTKCLEMSSKRLSSELVLHDNHTQLYIESIIV